MKRALVQELVALGLRPLAEGIVVESKTYGPAAEKGVRKLQAKKGLEVDGVVGKDTWRALGVNEPVVDTGAANGLSAARSKEYVDLWRSCAVRPQRLDEANGLAKRIAANKKRYVDAGKPHGVPWHVVGVIHMLESSADFTKHLHNGDPLTARTVRVPKGRPANGNPPFKWETSASDALVFDHLSTWTNWSVPGTLFVLERFNGFGYRDKGINTPYLWSFSNHYTKGKFVGGKQFSATAVSEQCGAAVLLRQLVAAGLTEIDGAALNGG
ncbi:MAG TPA: peptidoglycan-binding protein [Gaiellaceae bacterium]